LSTLNFIKAIYQCTEATHSQCSDYVVRLNTKHVFTGTGTHWWNKDSSLCLQAACRVQ